MGGVEPFAHQPALHIDQTDQNGIHIARGDLGFQIIETENCGHVISFILSIGCDRVCRA